MGDAFLRRGHDAVSFDLLPSESPGPHVQGDILDLGRDYWCDFDKCRVSLGENVPLRCLFEDDKVHINYLVAPMII